MMVVFFGSQEPGVETWWLCCGGSQDPGVR